MLVGRTAKERLISHPENTVASFKRFMGTEKTFMLGNRRFTAADLSSMDPASAERRCGKIPG